MYFENKVGNIYYETHGPEDAPVIFFHMGLT